MAFLDKTGLSKLWAKIKATFAKKEDGIYFVNGTQTSSTNVWTGSITGLTALYDGLTINYYLPYAGTSSGATLNINGLGAYPVYRYGRSTQITTHFAAGSMIKLTFRTSYKVAGTSYTNAWIADSFYDSNSYAYVRQYTTTTDADYPLLFAYETTLPSSYDTKYTRKASGFTYNPSTATLSVTNLKLNGTEVDLSKYALTTSLSSYVTTTDLSNFQTALETGSVVVEEANYASSAGSATSATKATQDGSGNVITSTYVKKPTTTTVYSTATQMTNPAQGSTSTSSILTFSSSLQAGDRVKAYFSGATSNTSAASYQAGMVEFEVFAAPNNAIVGSGSFMSNTGAQALIITMQVVSATQFKVSLYGLNANSYASMANVFLLKVERIR